MRNFEKEVSRKDTNDLDLCIERMQRMAYIRFQLSGENIMQFKRNLRVTFADQVASLGGTVGLFTGMSILSFCEILFWLFKLVFGFGSAK